MSTNQKKVIAIGGFTIDTKKYALHKILENEYREFLVECDLRTLKLEVDGWNSTGDIEYLDSIVALLSKNKAPISGFILEVIGELAEQRLLSKVVSNKLRRKELKQRNSHKKKLVSFGLSELKRISKEEPLYLVFTLIEICGMTTSNAYKYVACFCWIKAKNHEVRKFITAQKPVTIRKNYEAWKKTDDYTFLKNNIDLYREEAYPSMTVTQIRGSIIGDINVEDPCFQFIGDDH